MLRDIARSALDEMRHARLTSALAARFSARPEPIAIAPSPARTPFALENAVEGCVRETYAALLALHQAEAALDAEMRRAVHAIARDQLRAS